MVRPRFPKLPPAQQQKILAAASEEFAAHGFHDASLNRVIESAGISKGSMYYYFKGKDDLYAQVVRGQLEAMFARVGPFDGPVTDDPDAFWSALERYYLQLMTDLEATPQLAALIRGWVAAAGTPAMQQLQQGMEQAVVPWMERVLTEGQRIGAVRIDLPTSLLLAIAGGMGQAMDTWLLNHSPNPTDLPPLIGALIGMIRRALEPRAPRSSDLSS
jgi:AcrR family transcriptional regulator